MGDNPRAPQISFGVELTHNFSLKALSPLPVSVRQVKLTILPQAPLIADCFFRLPPWLSLGDPQVFHFPLRPLPSRLK